MSLPVIDALRGPRSRRDRIGRVYVVSTSELDHTLWWQGHPVAARQLHAA